MRVAPPQSSNSKVLLDWVKKDLITDEQARQLEWLPDYISLDIIDRFYQDENLLTLLDDLAARFCGEELAKGEWTMVYSDGRHTHFTDDPDATVPSSSQSFVNGKVVNQVFRIPVSRLLEFNEYGVPVDLLDEATAELVNARLPPYISFSDEMPKNEAADAVKHLVTEVFTTPLNRENAAQAREPSAALPASKRGTSKSYTGKGGASSSLEGYEVENCKNLVQGNGAVQINIGPGIPIPPWIDSFLEKMGKK